MKHPYNIAICPPPVVVRDISELKYRLKKEIGWFSAAGADAHITLDMVTANDAALARLTAQLRAFAHMQPQVELYFSEFSFFTESRTVFLRPTEASAEAIQQLFNQYKTHVPTLGSLTAIHPHLTIGKALQPRQFEQAKQLLASMALDTHFTCNQVAIRQFDPEIKQYHIAERFYFLPGTANVLAF